MVRKERAGDSRESMSDKEWIEDAWNSLMKFEPRELNHVAPAEKPAPEPLIPEPEKTVENEPVATPEPVIEAEPQPEDDLNKQRKNKLMLFIMKGNPDIFKRDDVEITEDEQNKVLDAIKNGGIHDREWLDIIGSIERPVDKKSPEEIFEEIEGDDYAKRVLARISKLGAENYEKTSAKEVSYVADNCRTAMMFEFLNRMFIKTMKENIPGTDAEKYEAAADKLESVMYGEQKEYWKTAQDLMAEAGK